MDSKIEPRIACIGWGSLIETPGCLATFGSWVHGGPMLPVEFARESGDGRMTLVICPSSARVPTRWILLDQPTVELARANLGYREYPKATRKWIDESIGFWDRESDARHGMEADNIVAWARKQKLDGVVWTNLPYGFKATRGVLPPIDEVLAHLAHLDATAQGAARNYVQNAPKEVDTVYRKKIAERFNW